MAKAMAGEFAFSGRTAGKLLRKRRGGGNSNSERRKLRQKQALIPRGKNRFERGFKFTYQDGTPCWGT